MTAVAPPPPARLLVTRRVTARVFGTRRASAWVGLPAAAAVAVVVRLAYVAVLAGSKLSDDEISFWTIAGNLAHGRGFSYQGRATAWRPPLYTGLLALCRVLGVSVRGVEVGQALLGAATPVLLFLLARRLGRSRSVGLLAAWVGAVYPPFVYFSGRLLAENVAIPLLILALWMTVEWLERGGWRWAALGGLAWGVSVLARPTSIPIVVVAFVAGVIGGVGRRRALDAAVLVVVCVVCVAPWMIRNAGAVGGAEPVTSNEGITVWAPNRLDATQLKNVLNDPRYPGMQNYSVYGRAFPGIEALARSKGFDFDHASEAAQDRWFRSLAVHAIEQRPGRFVVRTIERAALVLVPAPDNASQTARTGTGAKVVLWLTSGPVVLLGGVGLFVLAVRRRDGAGWFAVAGAVVGLGVVAVHLPYVRYRVGGVDPILIATGAWLVVEAWRVWGPRAGWTGAGLAGVGVRGGPADAGAGWTGAGPAGVGVRGGPADAGPAEVAAGLGSAPD